MASTTAAGPAITARFRELCFEFYTTPAAASKDGGNGKGGRALLEVFEGLAPSAGPAANSTASLPEVPLEAKWGNQIKQSGLDVAFFEALRRDPGLWYEFATVKNEARAAAHASMSASRVLTLKERIQNQRQQQAPATAAAAPAYEAILTAFRAYVVKYGSDPGLAALHHGLLAWLQRQQQGPTCVRWAVDIDALSERAPDFLTLWLDALFAVGTLVVDEEEDGRFTWELRADLSNAFLKRLARRVRSVAQPLTPTAATHAEKEIEARLLPSPTARTNVSGEKEDLATYIVNHIAALLSDVGVAV